MRGFLVTLLLLVGVLVSAETATSPAETLAQRVAKAESYRQGLLLAHLIQVVGEPDFRSEPFYTEDRLYQTLTYCDGRGGGYILVAVMTEDGWVWGHRTYYSRSTAYSDLEVCQSRSKR